MAVAMLLQSMQSVAVGAEPAAPRTAANAAPETRLTLPEAIDQALRANLDLAAVRREIDAAAALQDQAARLPNPVVSYDSESVPGRRAAGIVVTQPLELGGRRATRIRAAERATEAARADVALRAVEVRAATAQAFFDLVTAQDREQLARASVELARRALDVATRRVQAGRVSPVDQTRAEVAESAARVDLSQAQTELANARVRLAALFGQTEPRFGPADASAAGIPAAPAPAALADRLAGSPALARARAEIAQREAAAAQARALRTPSVALSAGSRTLIETGQRANVLGVSVAIPIFDANQGNIREAAVRVEQARDQLAAAEVRLRADAAQARERLAAAGREAALVRDEVLPGARRALDAATRGFELGKFGFLDVLDAQRTLFAGRAQLVRALTEAYRAAADLERLLGPGAADDGAAAPP